MLCIYVFLNDILLAIFPKSRDNNLHLTYNLTVIPPSPKGVSQIEVTFDISAYGNFINVSAQNKSTVILKIKAFEMPT